LRFLNIWQIFKVQTLGKYVLSSKIFSVNKMKNYVINITEFRPWEQNRNTITAEQLVTSWAVSQQLHYATTKLFSFNGGLL
jgi:hypothetical protein